MPQIDNCLEARSQITSLQKLDDNTIIFSTKFHGIKIISPLECETKLNFKHERLNSSVTAICFSPDAELVAFSTQARIHIMNMHTKELIKSIYTDGEEVNILTFDLSSKYIVAGSSNGRVLLYKYNSSSLLSRLCSFPYQRPKTRVKKNFVSSFAFYNNIFATSGYGGAIFVMDLHSRANKRVYLHGTFRKSALCFLNEKSIACGDNEGNLRIISLKDNILIKEISLSFRKIKQIILIPKTKFIIVHANTNAIAIIDTKEHKILHSNYLEFEDNIDSIEALSSEFLIVSLQNQKILHVKLPSASELHSLIIHNSLDEAYELIEREPMLSGTNEHKVLEQKYDKLYTEALQALVNQNKSSALQLTDMFKHIASKKESIRLLFQAFDNYPRFKTLYLEKKYALAYGMAQKFPALKKTAQYEYMEKRWKETFTNAQRHILLGKPEYAKALFKEYIAVTSKRPVIDLVIKHNNLFIEFLKALEKKDFKKVNQISSKNTLFTQMPIYKTLNTDIEQSISRIEIYIKKGNLDLAKKSLTKIEGTPNFALQIKQLYAMCDEVVELQKQYKLNNFKACYELIDLHPHLLFSKLGILLDKHWQKLMNECEEYASKGNIKDIKATLGSLIELDSRKDKVGDLLRVSFHVRVKALLSKKNFKAAQSIIYSYIDIFGEDSEMHSLKKKYELMSKKKLAITLTGSEKPSRDSWLKSKIITA